MNNNIAIKLTNVSKQYSIHHEKPTLVEKFYKGRDEKFWVLKDTNLVIKKGEKIGIIGPNGSGKTTLLKMISGITTPTSGKIETNGKVVSLIDLEAGFHPDLTGLQNIYLNGMILGIKKSKISSNLKKIIKFADIGKFIDTPLYTYSEGMKLRLGFSIAIHANPDIIILDEGLSTGDLEFQKKCQNYFNSFFKRKKTLLVSLHVLDFIKDNCSRIINVKNGIIDKDEPISEIHKYEK